MRSDVMKFFKLTRPLSQVGYFETAHQQELRKDLKHEIQAGGLVAISGIVGCGKTTLLYQLQSDLKQAKNILVSRSLAVDKDRVNLSTLMTALFFDLSPEPYFKIPTQSEKRERKLIAMIQKHRKLVALFVDEAHELHYQTLVKLKRLIELVRNNGGALSVILAGHPKLKNDLRRPNLEEIGARASVFTLHGIQGCQTEFIHWLLNECSQPKTGPTDLLTEPAIALLAEHLTTPLQIEQYLTMAFEEAYNAAQKIVTPDIINLILAKGLNDLEPRLIRHGYNTKVIAGMLNVRPGVVRSLLQGQLPPGRTQDLKEQMLRLGIPV